MKYNFRKYEDKDYNFIYELKKNAYKKYVEEIWGEWNDEKQHLFFDNYIAQQKDRIKIIVIDGTDIGYFDDKADENNYEVVNIIVQPEYQGKGIGTQILKNVIEENRNKDIDIQCFLTNPVVYLYKRLGFVEYEKTNTHIKLKMKALENNKTMNQ
ncbi:MAG: GNAT family N-acetyltransferase [Clostridiales bacterium]|nr:GNAT family N-acetyltransferase [Clostridiales bacterium]